MFSILGNIFLNAPRQTESTDTRQNIRRHDPDQERRKRKSKDREEQQIFGTEDDATVSVEALRVFLDNFLKSVQTEKQEVPETIPTGNQQPDKQNPKKSGLQVMGQAAQAADAYQSMADRTSQTPQHVGQDVSEAALSLGLNAGEIRAIHTLLEDLKELSQRNVEYLRIERSDSFLHSLEQAVEKAKLKAHK